MAEKQFFSWRQALMAADLSSSETLVALVISTYMNDHGHGAFPSQETIAANGSVTTKTVQRVTKSLEAKGWLRRSLHGFGGQRWKRYEYVIGFPDDTSPDPKAPDTVTAPSDGDDGAPIQKGPDTVSVRGPDTMTGASEKGPDTVSKRSGHCVQKVPTQCPTNSPYNSPMNSPGGGEPPPELPDSERWRLWEPNEIEAWSLRGTGTSWDEEDLRDFWEYLSSKTHKPQSLATTFRKFLAIKRSDIEKFGDGAQDSVAEHNRKVLEQVVAEFNEEQRNAK